MDSVPFKNPQDFNIDRWRASINDTAKRASIPPCVLATTVKIESNGHNIFQQGVPKGPGCGVGLCQITYAVDWASLDHPTFKAGGTVYGLIDPASNLHVSAMFFHNPNIIRLQQARNEAPAAFEKYASNITPLVFMAYNMGVDSVIDYLIAGVDPDNHTTNRYGERAMQVYTEYVAKSHANAT